MPLGLHGCLRAARAPVCGPAAAAACRLASAQRPAFSAVAVDKKSRSGVEDPGLVTKCGGAAPRKRKEKRTTTILWRKSWFVAGIFKTCMALANSNHAHTKNQVGAAVRVAYRQQKNLARITE